MLFYHMTCRLRFMNNTLLSLSKVRQFRFFALIMDDTKLAHKTRLSRPIRLYWLYRKFDLERLAQRTAVNREQPSRAPFTPSDTQTKATCQQPLWQSSSLYMEACVRSRRLPRINYPATSSTESTAESWPQSASLKYSSLDEACTADAWHTRNNQYNEPCHAGFMQVFHLGGVIPCCQNEGAQPWSWHGSHGSKTRKKLASDSKRNSCFARAHVLWFFLITCNWHFFFCLF